MNDKDKTKEQLMSELAELRRQNAELLNVSPEEKHEQSIESQGVSQRLLDAIFDAAPTCIKLISEDGSLQRINRAGLEMIDANSLDQVKGFCVYPLVSEEYREAFRTLTQKVFKGESQTLEFKMIGLTGRPLWLYTHAVPLRNEKGDIVLALASTVNITERKLVEMALQKSQTRLKSILMAAPAGIGIVVNRVLVEVNSHICEMTGRTRDELVGMSAWVLYPTQEDFDFVGREKYHQIAERGTGTVETRWIRKDGSILNVLLSSSPINPEDLSAGVTFIAIDITERKKAEDALRESKERLKLSLEAAHAGSWEWEIATNRAIWSSENFKIMGLLPGSVEPSYDAWLSCIHRDDSKRVVAKMAEVIQNQSDLDMEFRVVHSDGTIRWINDRGEFILDKTGKAVSMRGIQIDITERKQAEERLRNSEGKLRAFLNNISDTIWLIDANLNMVYVSPSVKRLLDISPEELIGKPSSLIIHPDDLGVVIGAQNYVMEHPGVSHTAQYRVKNKSGDWVPVESTGINMQDNPAINGVLVTMRDITERKQAYEALRENQSRLDLALQAAHMGVWRWEIKENRRYFDDLTCQLLGLKSVTFTGTAEEFYQAVHPEDREKIKAAIALTIEQDVLYEPKYRVVWPDESIHYITARGRLVRDDKGQPVRFNGILWDITDQLLLDQERIKTQKLESIGTLAGGIAHDFNNLLQGIFGYISMAKLTLDQKEKSLQMLEEAEKALHMSVNLTSQLLTFSKGGKPVKKIISLQPVIENSAKFALSGSRVDYSIMFDEELWTVEADEGQIGQVIQNIVLNADQSMPLGGTVVIAAKNVQTPNNGLPQLLGEGKHVEISFKDSGIGISELYLHKIFDPYFTTREKGSGLGLATSYSIVRNHGGVIKVESKVGKGTTFYVYLPAHEGGKEVLQACATFTGSHKGKGKILLMDDEKLIRNTAGELLKALKHEVDFAVRGEEAIEKYQNARDSGKPFDIVILDLTIRGGMGGKNTIERLLTIDPGIRAIVSSGYSGDDIVADYKKYGFMARLTKPYNLEELRDTLNRLLCI